LGTLLQQQLRAWGEAFLHVALIDRQQTWVATTLSVE
jgi:hypothetical protein